MEKWQKLLATEEHRTNIMNFLDDPKTQLIVIAANSAGHLVTFVQFPYVYKGKAVVFVKSKPVTLTVESYKNVSMKLFFLNYSSFEFNI